MGHLGAEPQTEKQNHTRTTGHLGFVPVYTDRHIHSCVYTQIHVHRYVQQNTGGRLLTSEQDSQGLTGWVSLTMPLEDLVPEARLHLSGWTSRKSAFAPRAHH